MKIAIFFLYIINLILLLLFSMHMFQLNSYFFKKHIKWIRKNISKIAIQELFIISSTVLLLLQDKNSIFSIINIAVLVLSIYYNLPKKKQKIKLKYTLRVIRMFAYEIALLFALCFISSNYFKVDLSLALAIINIISFIMCFIANLIDYPINKLLKYLYIQDAKKILSQMPNLIVIGVTGSYGKTSIKNFLSKVLSSKYEVLATPKNYNTTLGVVKTIRENLKPIHQIFICEMGATNIGDIKEICDIVSPTLGVITAIGPQHLESFKSIDNVIKTKFELLDSVSKNNGTMFLNYNNEYISKKDVKNAKVITYGINNESLDYNSNNLHSSPHGLTFSMKDKDTNEIIDFKTNLIGKHNVINLSCAIAVARYLNIPYSQIISKIREIKSIEHRLSLKTLGNITIIDDAYNSNPVSSKFALDTLGEFEGIKIAVTPGLIELGADEEKYNYELGEYMTKVCDYIYLVGQKHSKPIYDGIISKNFDKDKVFIVSSPEEAIGKIISLNLENHINVLLENDLPDNYNLR